MSNEFYRSIVVVDNVVMVRAEVTVAEAVVAAGDDDGEGLEDLRGAVEALRDGGGGDWGGPRHCGNLLKE